MPMQDLSGQINGLIVISSAALAITQYVHNNQKLRVSELQAHVRNTFEAGTNPSVEEVKSRFDELYTRQLPSVGGLIIALFVVLCAAAAIKVGDGIANIMVALSAATPDICTLVILCLVTIMSLTLFVLIIWTGWRLVNLRNKVSEFDREVAEFDKQMRMVRAVWDKGAQTQS